MSERLSDRIARASDDVLRRIVQTPVVQKLLMTGELNEPNRRAAVKELKVLYDLRRYSRNTQYIYQINGLTAEEREFFRRTEENADRLYDRTLDEFKRVIGSVPEDLSQRAPSKEMDAYFRLFDEIKETGNVVNVLTAFFANRNIRNSIYNYLENSPSFRENDLAKLILFQTMGCDVAVDEVRRFIDSRVREVTVETEKQMKATYRAIADAWLRGFTESYQ